MSQYTRDKRVLILKAHFNEHYTYAEIAKRFDSVTAKGARSLYNRTKTRAHST